MIRPTVDSLVLKSFASRQAGAPPRCMSRMRAAPHASTVSPEGGMLRCWRHLARVVGEVNYLVNVSYYKVASRNWQGHELEHTLRACPRAW